jgi:lipid A oxidase
MTMTRWRVAAWAVVAVLGVDQHPADADWLLSAYIGGARTAANTLSINGADVDFRISEVAYEGQSWRSPIYYGWRLRHTWDGRPNVGMEVEFTHAKAIADVTLVVSIAHDGVVDRAPLSTIVSRFELSHGLNLALANVVFVHTLPSSHGRVAIVARGGAGVAIPHIEVKMGHTSHDEYQLAGLAAAVGAGAELRLWRHVHAVTDVRLSFARTTLDVGENTIGGTFRTTHFDTGIGVSF